MASSPPPSTAAGVPPSGNGKYIAIALLLLLGVGGVIAWKVMQKPPEQITEKLDAGPPVSPSGRKTTDDDIPLPPEVPDAAVEDAGKKVATNNGGGDNGCAAKCSGTDTPELSSALQMRARQAHACYDSALAADNTLKGKVVIALKIGAGGQVCSAGVASNELSTPNVANCMATKFRGNSFPAPKGGCVDINVPINLTPTR